MAARFYNQATTKTDRLAAVLSKGIDDGPASAPQSPQLQRVFVVDNHNFPVPVTEMWGPAQGITPEALSRDLGYGK